MAVESKMNSNSPIALFTGNIFPRTNVAAQALEKKGYRILTFRVDPAFVNNYTGTKPTEVADLSNALASVAAAPAGSIIVCNLEELSIGGADKLVLLAIAEVVAVVRFWTLRSPQTLTVCSGKWFNELSKMLAKVEDGPKTVHLQDEALSSQMAEAALALVAKAESAMKKSLNKAQASKARVLLLGGGGREHTIAWKLAQSPAVEHIFVAPGNGGTELMGKTKDSPGFGRVSNVAIGVEDVSTLTQFAKENDICLCAVGPEAPLVVGVADAMATVGVPTFGPIKAAAQLEASKAFSKDFMKRHGLPTAAYETFTDYQSAAAYVERVEHKLVVKASGLAAGKGVLLPETKEETLIALRQMMVDRAFGDAGSEVVLEELLEGEEVSALAFCDGKTAVLMPPAQDHKRALDGDRGLNTGGMGAYAPAPALTGRLKDETEALLQRAVAATAADGFPFVGVLYAGLMLTRKGVMLLEFNVRFGDPETQVLLPLLQSDLYQVMMDCCRGTLSSDNVLWREGKFAATVVAAAGGYPEKYRKGDEINIADFSCAAEDVQVFHAGTQLTVDASGSTSVLTSGGRVLAVTGVQGSLKEAVDLAYKGMANISFKDMFYRRDIAHRALKVRLGVLGSTRGSSLQPLLDAIASGSLAASVQVVVSNKTDTGILERAAKAGIEAVHVPTTGKSREEYDREVSDVLERRGVSLVLLVGYMRILSPWFCQRWHNRCLNVHPSLLPDFAGGMDLQVHEAVIKAGKKTSGCTVHVVTEEVDAGPIIVQREVQVEQAETPQSLKAKVQAEEGRAFMEAIELFRSLGERFVNAGPRGRGDRITYADAGVDVDKGNEFVSRIGPMCKATRRPGCDASLGGFGGLFDLEAAGYGKDTVLVACTDGVGTKLKVANAVGRHDTIGIDLVAMCVNDALVQGAEPLFFLDYFATGKLELAVSEQVVKGVAQGCLDAGCALIGGETAEMPGMYAAGDYDIAGFAVAAVRKDGIIPKDVEAGQVLLGLSSSGVHSNGYSLVRRLVERSGLGYDSPSPFSSEQSLGDALLAPTKIYVQCLLPLLKQQQEEQADLLIAAMAHITGGGLTENIPRVLPAGLAVTVDLTSWELPPVFRWLQKQSGMDDAGMLKTFNCGVGMVLLLPASKVEAVQSLLKAQGEDSFVMGKVHKVREGASDQQFHAEGSWAA